MNEPVTEPKLGPNGIEVVPNTCRSCGPPETELSPRIEEAYIDGPTVIAYKGDDVIDDTGMETSIAFMNCGEPTIHIVLTQVHPRDDGTTHTRQATMALDRATLHDAVKLAVAARCSCTHEAGDSPCAVHGSEDH